MFGRPQPHYPVPMGGPPPGMVPGPFYGQQLPDFDIQPGDSVSRSGDMLYPYPPPRGPVMHNPVYAGPGPRMDSFGPMEPYMDDLRRPSYQEDIMNQFRGYLPPYHQQTVNNGHSMLRIPVNKYGFEPRDPPVREMLARMRKHRGGDFGSEAALDLDEDDDGVSGRRHGRKETKSRSKKESSKRDKFKKHHHHKHDRDDEKPRKKEKHKRYYRTKKRHSGYHDRRAYSDDEFTIYSEDDGEDYFFDDRFSYYKIRHSNPKYRIKDDFDIDYRRNRMGYPPGYSPRPDYRGATRDPYMRSFDDMDMFGAEFGNLNMGVPNIKKTKGLFGKPKFGGNKGFGPPGMGYGGGNFGQNPFGSAPNFGMPTMGQDFNAPNQFGNMMPEMPGFGGGPNMFNQGKGLFKQGKGLFGKTKGMFGKGQGMFNNFGQGMDMFNQGNDFANNMGFDPSRE